MNYEVRQWKRGEKNGIIVAGGNGGKNLNQLNFPSSIFVDKDYSLYISDTYNHRVMKWLKDAKEGFTVAGGHKLSQLRSPQGIIVDQLGSVYVADSGNYRVMRWCKGAKTGIIVVQRNKEEIIGPFNYPTGLSFDLEENLYVVDRRHHGIQKFDLLM
jgi:sugar lactone lactonase YvrE